MPEGLDSPGHRLVKSRLIAYVANDRQSFSPRRFDVRDGLGQVTSVGHFIRDGWQLGCYIDQYDVGAFPR
jgi:hypothetical protein